MEYCSECGQKVSVGKNTPCKKCNGERVHDDPKRPGEKIACGRCNGSGKEIRNVSRRNRSRANMTENQRAKELQEWWRQVNPAAEFARTPASGGSKLKDGWDLRGDVTTNDPAFPFFVECKKEQAWELHEILMSSKGGRLGDYVRQVIRENVTDKWSVVIFSHPGPSQPTFMMLFADNPADATTFNTMLGFDATYSFCKTLPKEDKKPTTIYGVIAPYGNLFRTNPRHWLQWFASRDATPASPAA